MAFATCVPTVLDKRRSLPVDAMISDSIFTSTHAITINAPPEQVWPWNESWRKALLVCGILSSLLSGAMIGAIGSEGYSRISPGQRNSRLEEEGHHDGH